MLVKPKLHFHATREKKTVAELLNTFSTHSPLVTIRQQEELDSIILHAMLVEPELYFHATRKKNVADLSNAFSTHSPLVILKQVFLKNIYNTLNKMY